MKTATPFAQPPPTLELSVVWVRRQLARDCQGRPYPPPVDLDLLAEAAVLELWDSQVKAFVPVLALRRAREVLATT